MDRPSWGQLLESLPLKDELCAVWGLMPDCKDALSVGCQGLVLLYWYGADGLG